MESKPSDIPVTNLIQQFEATDQDRNQYGHEAIHTDDEIEELKNEILRVLNADELTDCIISESASDYGSEHPSQKRFNQVLIDNLSPIQYMSGESKSGDVSEKYRLYQTKNNQIFLMRTEHTAKNQFSGNPDRTITWRMIHSDNKKGLEDAYLANNVVSEKVTNTKPLKGLD